MILSPKAWPDSSTSEALASIIASHLYKGSRLAKTTSTASTPSAGGFQLQIGSPCLLAVLHESTRATVMKGRFMRDLRQCWLDITLAPIPSQKNQTERSGRCAHPRQRIAKRRPWRPTDHLLQAALPLGGVSFTTHTSMLESCPHALMGIHPHPTSMRALRR